MRLLARAALCREALCVLGCADSCDANHGFWGDMLLFELLWGSFWSPLAGNSEFTRRGTRSSLGGELGVHSAGNSEFTRRGTRSSLGGELRRIGGFLGSFWGSFLGSIWGLFGVLLGPLWPPFGPI
jgi:hypothetical protein